MGEIAQKVSEEKKVCSECSWAETSLGRSLIWGQIILQKEHTPQFQCIVLMVSVLLIKDVWEWLETDACGKKLAKVWWKQERQGILCLW